MKRIITIIYDMKIKEAQAKLPFILTRGVSNFINNEVHKEIANRITQKGLVRKNGFVVEINRHIEIKHPFLDVLIEVHWNLKQEKLS